MLTVTNMHDRPQRAQENQERELSNHPPMQVQVEKLRDSARIIASSALNSEVIGVDSPSFLPSSLSVTQSTAAKAREKQLRDDPLAIVLGPLYVECKGCNKRIKLSTKSLYDLSHWRTHRARCLKRQPRLPRKPSSKPDMGTSEALSLRRSEKPGTPLNPPDVVDSGTPASVENQPPFLHPGVPVPPLHPPDAGEAFTSKDHTLSPLPQSSTAPCLSPPLTPTVEGGSSVSEEQSTPLSKASTSHLLPADIIFADYLHRSNRHMVTSTSSVHPRWQDWTWAQLRLPQFQALDHDSHNDEHFPPNDTALSLSLLAHS